MSEQPIVNTERLTCIFKLLTPAGPVSVKTHGLDEARAFWTRHPYFDLSRPNYPLRATTRAGILAEKAAWMGVLEGLRAERDAARATVATPDTSALSALAIGAEMAGRALLG